ncbi:response regulator transcription factor [Nocardia sp. NBC_00416]|uniref:response regulator transcription factor n=1 Tax=Nocardia sp. NBC_00416 TaxID=2975991 RepID=UPI002E1C8281
MNNDIARPTPQRPDTTCSPRFAVVGGGAGLVTELRLRTVRAEHLSRGAELVRRHHDYDAAIIDLKLTDTTGLEALIELRRLSRMPVVMVGSRTDERTVVRCLRTGADAYLVHPVRVTELIVRLQTIARRVAPERRQAAAPQIIVTGDIHIDLRKRHVEVTGRAVTLTPMEFALLYALVRQPGRALSRHELMDRVWGSVFLGKSRTLDVHIASLRAKLGRPELITTLYGYGYLWNHTPSADAAAAGEPGDPGGAAHLLEPVGSNCQG